MNQINKNLENINYIRKETNAKFFLALKGFSNDNILKYFIDKLDGVSSSGVFESKLGKEQPELRGNKIKEINYGQIYKLREKGLSYKKIADELERQGIKISLETVRSRCKEIYDSRGEKEPELRGRKIKEVNNEQIYNLREKGLSYRKIADELKRQGIKISSGTVGSRCKLIENGTVLTRQGVGQKHKKILKSNEQQLAKAILNLVITRKATIEQIQQIADYYGVDLEKTMNSLEER